MNNHERAGQLPQQSDLINIPWLVSQYYTLRPDPTNTQHAVNFGTSGHRGIASESSFNEQHILAITQAIVQYRLVNRITGPCFVGKDTHALSEPAFISVIEVLTANNINVIIQENNGFTPTPAISHAILNYNRRNTQLADGIVITPSHNPPEYGGIKYNTPQGGAADVNITKVIADRANALIRENLGGVKRLIYERALNSGHVHPQDLIFPYVEQLSQVVDIKAIREAGLKLGADPLGGAGIEYWARIADRYLIDLELVNDTIDPSFRFMPFDYDGVIRMDCSSEYSMSGLLALKDKFDIAFGNDPDFDRHGIVTPLGLMNPNHYLTVAIDYLFRHRPLWKPNMAIGKTLVSTAMIDKIAKELHRELIEVPVGFKWFVNGLYNSQIAFAGEESSGASFLSMNGSPWTTDKDGIIMCLLAAEIMAITDKSPQEYYTDLTAQLGQYSYSRIQAIANEKQRAVLATLTPDMVKVDTLAGDKISQCLTNAPGNQAPIGGLKVITENGWFTARPSGTENTYKIYCESLVSDSHRQQIEQEAVSIVNNVLADVTD